MIGKAIDYFLKLREMKQTTLAEKAEISTAAVTQYIKGTRNPSDKRLVKIAEVLGVSVDELKEVAKSIESEQSNESKEVYIDDRSLKRRLSMIYSRSDLSIELSKYVILSARFRIHDLLHETDPSRKARRPVVMDRESSPIESLAVKVVRDFIAENESEIADRLEDELEKTHTSIEDIIEQIRNNYDQY